MLFARLIAAAAIVTAVGCGSLLLHEAEEEAKARRAAETARLAPERLWFKGVRTECRPSQENIARMKTWYRYSPSFVHLAVVGSSGSGKSSFINAVRGLSNIAARTEILETTDTAMRYPDPRPKSRMIWYDVPGAGTPDVPDWQYFNDLGLYIFDCIIVLIENCFSESDLAILHACEQFTNAAVFIVHSKSDQHIKDMALDRMPRGFDLCDAGDEERSQFQEIISEERRRFIYETSRNVQTTLESNNLFPKKVYIVCKDAILEKGDNLSSPEAIDEIELLNDVRERLRTSRRLRSGLGTRGYMIN